jgi:putative transposase
VTADLKQVYRSATEEEALLELDRFGDIWDDQYPQISKSWQNRWHNLNMLFNYPDDIRKTIYTTNAIESLNNVIRRAIKKRKVFPSDDSARKMVYLTIMEASKKWTMPVQNWRQAMSRFIIEFGNSLESTLTKIAVTQNLLQGRLTPF